MLSFSSGRPIGKVEGGKLDGALIHIKDENEKEEEDDCDCCGRCDPRKCIKKPCCGGCSMCGGDDSDEGLDAGTEFKLPSGKFIPVPNIDTREVTFIAGPSGSGKSTLASKYIEIYKKLFPKNPIIIFSRKPTDPALDRLKPLRFMIDESIVSDPPDIMNELPGGACVLFDDCNTFQDDKIKKAVAKLMHDIMEIGRSYEIYCIITSHLINPNERKDSRTIWNEAHTVTLFPKSGNRHGMVYALKNYCGLDNKKIEKILNLPSRWVLIGKQYPMYVLHEKGAELI